ncbi:MAG: hypothetical protein WAN28_13390, partial [Terracidiphilus sp.]
DARDTGTIAAGALGGAKGGLGFEVLDVFDAVLDEERLLEAGQLEIVDAAIELGKHGGKDGILLGLGAGLGGGEGRCEEAEANEGGGVSE